MKLQKTHILGENSKTSEEVITSIIKHLLVAELEKEVMAWNPRCLSASNQEPGLPQTCCRAMTKSHKWWCRCHFLWVGSIMGVWRKRQCSWVHPKTSFQCHKLASALPGVSPHCHCLSALAPFLTPKTYSDTNMCDDQSDQSKWSIFTDSLSEVLY